MQLFVDVDDFTDVANLMVILFAIVAPFSIAFQYFNKAKNKYFMYKARHADTVVRHTHSTNRGAHLIQYTHSTLIHYVQRALIQYAHRALIQYAQRALIQYAQRPISDAVRHEDRGAPDTTCACQTV